MKVDTDVKNITKEAIVAITKSTELFVAYIVSASQYVPFFANGTWYVSQQPAYFFFEHFSQLSSSHFTNNCFFIFAPSIEIFLHLMTISSCLLFLSCLIEFALRSHSRKTRRPNCTWCRPCANSARLRHAGKTPQ